MFKKGDLVNVEELYHPLYLPVRKDRVFVIIKEKGEKHPDRMLLEWSMSEASYRQPSEARFSNYAIFWAPRNACKHVVRKMRQETTKREQVEMFDEIVVYE
jgi:hypothetical protein